MDLTDRKRESDDSDRSSPLKKTRTDKAFFDHPSMDRERSNGVNGHGGVEEKTRSAELIMALAKVPEDFKANGLNVVKMRIVHGNKGGSLNSRSSIISDKAFKPLFVYQFFPEPRDEEEIERAELQAQQAVSLGSDDRESDGEDMVEHSEDAEDDIEDVTEGLIVGYKDLKVEMSFTPAGLKPYIVTSSSQSLAPDLRSVPSVVGAVELGYEGEEVMTSESAFLEAVEKEKDFQPFGTKIWTSHGTGENGTKPVLEVYEVGTDSVTDGYPGGFAAYLKGIQPFLKWFVYASSIISTDHVNWLHYFMYEKTAENTFRLVGYCSVYRYTVWPKKVDTAVKQFGDTLLRCRIAQFLILPPYQKVGYGTQLLMTIVSRLQQNPLAYEITVEEATPEFQRLFDSATTFMVNKFITENNDADGMNLARWYSGATMKNLQKKLKLSPRTVKQSLDILACQTAQKGEAVTVREFRSKMKAELKKKAEKNVRDHEKSLQRLALGYYSVAEGNEKEETKLMALWNVNLNEQIQKELALLETDELDNIVRDTIDRYQKVSERIGTISY